MCDEYDEERMWAFWRRLEMQQGLNRQEDKSEEIDLPVTVSLPEPQQPGKARPRPLTH